MDQEQQNTLLLLSSIFHYIIGFLLLLVSCLPLLYVLIGSLMVIAGFYPPGKGGAGETMPFFVVGGVFLTVGGILCTIGLILAICVLACARRLYKKRKYVYCLTIAAVECLFFPFGTIIGVLTIVLLANHDIKESFS